MYKSIFSKNNTDDSRTVVESKGITYLPLDFSSKQVEEKETYKNPLEWLVSNLNSVPNTNSRGASYEGYSPRYTDFELNTETNTDTEINPETEIDIPDTFSSKEEFKSVMLPLYAQVLTSRGLDPSFARALVAQDGLETNWGKSTIGNYNYGNITGSSGNSKKVSEYINGTWTKQSQTFVNYDNVTDYINAKIDLLSKPRYDVFSHPVSEFAQRVKAGGYATAPNYAEALNNTIRTLRRGGILKFSTGWGVGDIGYKDTLTTYKRNPLNQLFASTKDDKTAFSEKHFDNVRRYISDKVDSSKLTDDVLYDIFLDFDKYNIKDLDFTQRQNLIDNVMSTSKKSYLDTLAKHEIFYALEGLYGSSHIKKGRFGLKMESPETDNLDLFGMSEYHGYTPTWDDLYNFTASYETFNPKVYWLKDNEGNQQELIGHGIALSRVNPDVAKRWRANGISEEESLEWMRNEYAKLDALFSKTIKNYKNLPMELRVPILDAAYNTSGSNFFTKSKNLRNHIENGDHYVTIAAELDHSMNHSVDEKDKNLGSWLAVRSAARRAMALGEYNYDWQHKDKYGRHILPGKSGPQDWKFSPYYNKYKNLKTKHAIYFR